MLRTVLRRAMATKAPLLSSSERAAALKALPGWAVSETHEAIEKEYRFRDFKEAWGWMNKVAAYADRVDHHPEWLNVYNRVRVRLSTHDSGGITEKDIALAKEMESQLPRQ